MTNDFIKYSSTEPNMTINYIDQFGSLLQRS